jgi:4-amino-4-deoxy-L-arabinose transferase-like glycosyltransferase
MVQKGHLNAALAADSHRRLGSASGDLAVPAPAPLRVFPMILIALSLRLIVASFLLSDHLNPARDNWKFGWETGRLARSLAAGHGFSSPLFGDTGPSAWMAPLYPLFLAGIFKLFGIYSVASAVVAVSLNSFFAALTCVPIVRVSELSFGRGAARAAGWIWVFFPYSIYLAGGRIWSNSLAALFMALVLWQTVRLSRNIAAREWLIYGLTWGLAALTEPSLLAVLPCLLCWLLWRARGQRLMRLAHTALALAIILAVVAPWIARNSIVFHRFIPLRDNFWLVLWQSNTGDTSDLYPDWANPPHSVTEMAEMQRVGELAYMQEKRTMALANLRAHPLLHTWITIRRIGFFWTGFWSLSAEYSRNEPFQIPNALMSIFLTLGMIAGMRSAWRTDFPRAAPFLLSLFFFPLLFYVTHPGIEYRHPIDPLVVCFLGVAVSNTEVPRLFALALVRLPTTKLFRELLSEA